MKIQKKIDFDFIPHYGVKMSNIIDAPSDFTSYRYFTFIKKFMNSLDRANYNYDLSRS